MNTETMMPSAVSVTESHFDADYYAKWYRADLATREWLANKSARFVLSYIDHMDAAISTVLDLGCGLGLWRKALLKQNRRLRYTGVEFSSHLCEEMGWQQGDVRTYSADNAFDLVICQAVLQYVTDADCEQAISNLARLSRRFLYLEVLTAADAQEICADDGTDFNVHVREARWYAARLAKHFVNLGGGLYAKPELRPHYYELWVTDR